MHALVFWGFVVLMLQVIILFGRTFDAGWSLPGFGPTSRSARRSSSPATCSS